MVRHQKTRDLETDKQKKLRRGKRQVLPANKEGWIFQSRKKHH